MATEILMPLAPAAPPVPSHSLTEPMLNGDILYEVVDGEIRELPPMSARETRFANNLLLLLGAFAKTASLGVVDAEMLFLLDNARGLQRRTDVSFVSYRRWPKGKPVPGTPAWEVVPDLAVEVVSPTNGANEVIGKVEEYFTCGVRRVWVFYPLYGKVYDYASPTAVQILTRADRLSGADVLPGFEVALSEIFEDPAGVV